ncbi:uncharacterized protein DEA37_0001117, partial [Paragonimus westermani]
FKGSSGYPSPIRSRDASSKKTPSVINDGRRNRSTSSPPEDGKSNEPALPLDIGLDERTHEYSMALFMVEVKLLSDEEAPLQIELTQWLEMSKTVYKQLKYVCPRSLNFRVKHYPSNPLTEFPQEKARQVGVFFH